MALAVTRGERTLYSDDGVRADVVSSRSSRGDSEEAMIDL